MLKKRQQSRPTSVFVEMVQSFDLHLECVELKEACVIFKNN